MEKPTNGSLREQCIEESLRIIADKGVMNLSIREVARRLGVSHGAPYKHFTNRDALIVEIAIEGLAVLESYLTDNVDYDARPARENFEQMCHNYVRFAMEQHDYFQLILWTDLPRGNEEYPRLANAAQKVFSLLLEMLNHLKESYQTRKDDDDLAVLHMFSAMHGYASLMTSGKLAVFEFNLEDLNRISHSIAQAVFDGLFL